MNYGNGFFYLAEIGDFRLAQNGCFHLALTKDGVSLLFQIYMEILLYQAMRKM